jgi:hypothetical protein
VDRDREGHLDGVAPGFLLGRDPGGDTSELLEPLADGFP